MNAPQCDHRDPPRGRRSYGRRCQRAARYRAFPVNGEGAGVFCQRHGVERSAPGMKLEPLPALGRCECCVGDTPHSGEQEHRRRHSRCSRTATVHMRKAADVTIGGKPIPAGPWSGYCELCAQAIEAYQGDIVERLKKKEAA